MIHYSYFAWYKFPLRLFCISVNWQIGIAFVNALLMHMCLSDILIRIARCHSEGCDTKVYAVKAVGFRCVCHFYLVAIIVLTRSENL